MVKKEVKITWWVVKYRYFAIYATGMKSKVMKERG